MVTSSRIYDFRLTFKSCLEAFIHSHRLCRLRAIMNVGITVFIGIRAYHCNLLEPGGIHRKESVVLQQHKRLTRSTKSILIVCRSVDLLVCPTHFLLCAVRLVKKSHLELYTKDISNSFIYGLHAYSAFIHKFAQREHIAVRAAESTTHIQASLDRLTDRFLHIRSSEMFGEEILYGIRV